jgi:hypothetical protein
MLFPSPPSRYRRPARAGDSEIPVLGLIVVLLLILCAVGGGFVMLAWQRARQAEMMALEQAMAARDAEMRAREEAELARQQVEAAAARTQAQLQEAKRRERLTRLEQGLILCQQGKSAEGLLWMVRGLQEAGDDADLERLYRCNLAAWAAPPPDTPVLIRHTAPVTALAASPDGRLVLGGDDRGMIQMWDSATGKPAGQPIRQERVINVVTMTSDGTTILVGDDSGEVKRVDAATANAAGETITCPGPVLALDLRPGGREVMAGTCERGVWLLEGDNRGDAVKPFTPESPVLAAALLAQGGLLLSGHEDGLGRFWTLPGGAPAGEPLRHGNAVRAVAFSPDGKRIVTGGDRTARLWDTATRRSIARPVSCESEVLSAAFLPNGQGVLLGYKDGSIRTWPAPRPIEGTVERLQLWAEVNAGAELDAGGAVRPLDEAARAERKRRLDAQGGAPKP